MKSPTVEYDSNDNVVYFKNINGDEYSYDYDSSNVLRFYKETETDDEIQKWRKWYYNSTGVLTYSETSSDSQYWYHSNGIVSHDINSMGKHRWYDSKGRITHEEYPESKDHPEGLEVWYEYDGDMIHQWNSKGIETWYDSDGRITCRKYSSGLKEVYVYDEDDNVIDTITSTTTN